MVSILKLPQDVVENIAFLAIVDCHATHNDEGSPRSRPPRSSDREPESASALKNLKASCRGFHSACGVEQVARRCLAEPLRFNRLLGAFHRVPLLLFLRASGGYGKAVEAFGLGLKRIERENAPAPVVAALRKLCGRLFAQIGMYTDAETMLLAALEDDRRIQGTEAPEVASTLHILAEMLRGSVSACQTVKERYKAALRGVRYSRECLRIRRKCFEEVSTDVGGALHMLGYHCAEYANGAHALAFFEHSRMSLEKAHYISKQLGDVEMTATTLQDLGLCFYYQMRYRAAMKFYQAACHTIVANFGSRHPDLAVPTFNIANVMCAAGSYDRAIDFYKLSYSINMDALGPNHSWTVTAHGSLQKAVQRLSASESELLYYSDNEVEAHFEVVGSAIDVSSDEDEDPEVGSTEPTSSEQGNSSKKPSVSMTWEEIEQLSTQENVNKLLLSLVEDPVMVEDEESEDYYEDYDSRSEDESERGEVELNLVQVELMAVTQSPSTGAGTGQSWQDQESEQVATSDDEM